MKPLVKLFSLVEDIEEGKDSLDHGTKAERARKRQIVLTELMARAMETEDAGDLLELLEFTRKYGVKMRHDLEQEMKSEAYYPCPMVLERLRKRAEEDMKRQAAEDAKGLLKRDTKRIESIGPMLPFLQPGRVDIAD